MLNHAKVKATTIHHFDGETPTGQWSGVIVKWDSVTLPRVPDGQIEGGVKSQ